MRKVVGIDRKIKRTWVDAVIDRMTQTTDEAELRTFLNKHLKDELPGKESRAKTTGIILRIWSGIPPERVSLRDRAIAMLPRISGQERIWLHWGMTALAYPFFRDTADVVGRLLALQDDFTTAQVQARMLTTWGDRATTKEAAQKIITMLVDWEVLRSTKTKGYFLLARKMMASTPDIQLWLLEALLGANDADEIEARQLLRLPESFPFTLSIGIADLRKNESFNIHRQGLDMDMVALRKVKLEPPPKPTNKAKKKKTARANHAGLFDMEFEEVLSNNCKPVAIPIPEGPFAVQSAECAEQFRDGHYFGCIALTQAVLEAMIRHVWRIKLKKRPDQDGTFGKNVETLHKKKLISDEWKINLERMWTERHSFHYLRPSVECDKRALEETARNRLNLLNQLEQEFFGLTLRDGIGVPDHPDYWSIKEPEELGFSCHG